MCMVIVQLWRQPARACRDVGPISLRPDQPEDALGSKDGTVFRTGAALNGAGPEARWEGDRGRLSSPKELGESAQRAGNVQASKPVPPASRRPGVGAAAETSPLASPSVLLSFVLGRGGAPAAPLTPGSSRRPKDDRGEDRSCGRTGNSGEREGRSARLFPHATARKSCEARQPALPASCLG